MNVVLGRTRQKEAMVKEEAFEEAKELPAKHEGSHFVGNARASWAYNEADALRTVVTGGLRGRSVDLWCGGGFTMIQKGWQ